MKFLSDLSRQLQAPQVAVRQQALQRAFYLAGAFMLLPGLPLGLIYQLTRPAPFGMGTALALVLAAGALSFLAFRLAEQVRQAEPPGRTARLSAALQLGSAPAVPALLAVACWHVPLALLGCLGVAVVAYVLAMRRLHTLANEG